ncbi:MAG: imidazole glycerol phosphate synthase subunit HisH [Opitutaceae bacterium]|nr:imidazole glycerol phosphate synthase subunit HisH [Opitutaceae bacterium]MBP9913161.1 imidazole glycerol phosphate synthase subunit HisH [Opitutaceae bacterium]
MAGPTIAIIDYGMGNLRSVAKAVETAGGEVRVVTRPDEIGEAAGLVLPGVGALADCISALKAAGLDAAVRDWIAADKPFLGVCLGMQALFDFSEEADTPGLGIFPGKVVRFRVPAALKVPHMGWNTVRFTQPDSPLTATLAPEGEAFYFVHSYYCMPADPALVLAECEYGGVFTAAIARGRCFATQFHPEKSQAKGIQLYRNFIALVARG